METRDPLLSRWSRSDDPYRRAFAAYMLANSSYEIGISLIGSVTIKDPHDPQLPKLIDEVQERKRALEIAQGVLDVFNNETTAKGIRT